VVVLARLFYHIDKDLCCARCCCLQNIWTDSKGAASLLSLSVKQFLARHSETSLLPIASRRSDTLASAVALMLENKIHRVWVVDTANKPVGVVAMTDVFKVVRDHVVEESAAVAADNNEQHTTHQSTIKTLQGHAIVNENGRVTLRMDAERDQQLWTAQHIGNDKLRLSNGGKQLAVDSQHVVALLDAASPDTVFRVLRSDTGAIALADAHNGFLEAHGNTVVSRVTDTGRPTRHQWFKMTGAFGSTK
jgi:CBS domain-containing protein